MKVIVAVCWCLSVGALCVAVIAGSYPSKDIEVEHSFLLVALLFALWALIAKP